MEIVKVKKSEGGKQVVSARELYSFLSDNSGNFIRWSTTNIGKSAFSIEGIDYQRIMLSEEGRSMEDFVITLEFAKRLSMMANTSKGNEARTYFLECEKLLNAPLAPKTRLELARENLALIEEIELKDSLLLEQAPKVEFYNEVTQSDTDISIGEASKLLGLPYGSITLFKKLREAQVLMHTNIPYQMYVSNGWFRVVENKYKKKNGTTGISLKTVVFQKGLDGIRKLLNK